MSLVTLEGIVEQGQIKLKDDIHLPDNARVYVVVPDMRIGRVVRIASPCLAHSEQARDFVMEEVQPKKATGEVK